MILYLLRPTTPKEETNFVIEATHYVKDSTGKYIKVGTVERDMALYVLDSGNNTTPVINLNQEEFNICSGEEIKISAQSSDNDGDTTALTIKTNLKTATVVVDASKRLQSGYVIWKPGEEHISSNYYWVYFDVKEKNKNLYNWTQKAAKIKVTGTRPKIKIAHTDSGCGNYHFYLTGDTDKIRSLNWLINGNSVSSLKQFSYKVAANGVYYVKVISTVKGSNCTATFTDTLKHNSFPYNNLTSFKDTTICKGSSVQLKLNYTKGTYKWRPSTGLNNDTLASPSASPASSVKYYVNVIDENGCAHTDSVQINVTDFEVIIGNDTGVCAGKTAVLKVKHVQGATYQWQPTAGVNDPTAAETFVIPTTSTTYIVSVKNAFGCVKKDSIKVTVGTTNANAGPDVTICYGDSVLLQAGGGFTYKWYNANGSSISEGAHIWVKPLADAEYTVLAKDSLGCTGTTDKVAVKVNKIVTGVSADVEICPGDTVKLSAWGGNKYVWEPDSTFTVVKENEILAFPLNTTNYKLQITDTITGCSHTKAIKVTVLNDCVLPGDANHDLHVNYKDILFTGMGLWVNGKARINQVTDWKAVKCDNWTRKTPAGLNYKHMDATGDGKITPADTAVVSKNYSRSMNYKFTYKADSGAVSMKVLFLKDTFYAGDTVMAHIILGDTQQKASNLYGYGFGYSVTSTNKLLTEPKINLEKIALKTPNFLLKSAYNNTAGQYESGIVRTDKLQENYSGKIALMWAPIADTSAFEDNLPITFSLTLNEALLIDIDGNEVQPGLVSGTTYIKRNRYKKPVDTTHIGIAPQSILHNIHIYPNPANSQIIISGYSEAEPGDVTITNTLGQVVLQQKLLPNQTLKLDVKHFPAGLYMVSVKNNEKQTVKKLMISR